MRIIVAVLLAVCATRLVALEDTRANREREVDRYLAVMPPREMLSQMSEAVAKSAPADKREAITAAITRHLDIGALHLAMRDSMVKVFTADELKALADFYSSEVGRSAMSKMGAYMAEAMPAIQAEMAKALAKTKIEFPDL